MNYTTLSQRIETAGHGLCVGLDPDPSKLPAGTDLASFCIGIIDATAHVAIAYKPNFAFFEALGRPGWDALDAVTAHLRELPQKPYSSPTPSAATLVIPLAATPKESLR